MKKIILCLIALFGFTFNVKALMSDNYGILFESTITGDCSQTFNNVVVDDDGNIIAVGHYTSTNLGLTHYAYDDAMIWKFDSEGNVIWKNSYATYYYDYFSNILAFNNYYYAVGYVNNYSKNMLLIVKYDIDGNEIFSKTFNISSSSSDTIQAVSTDGENIIIVGTSDYSSFIATVDTDGNLISSNILDKSDYDVFVSVMVDDDSYVSAGAILNSNYELDSYIAMYDSNLNILWEKTFDVNGDDCINQIITDGTYLIVVGETAEGGFIGKIDNDGNIVSLVTMEDIYYTGVVNDINNGYIVVGVTSVSSSNIEIIGGEDNVIVRYDSSLDVISIENFGTSYDDQINEVYENNDIIALVGYSTCSSTDCKNASIIAYELVSYNITTITDGNGEIEASTVYGYFGDLVTFTITAKSGYTLSSLTLTASDGTSVTYELSDETYTFTVSQDTVIEATFSEIVEDVVEVDTTTTEETTEQVEETNPNTGSFIPLVLIPLLVIGITFINKKQIISKI